MKRAPSLLVLIEVVSLLAFGVLAFFTTRGSEQGELVPLDSAALSTGSGTERWYGIFFEDQHVGFSMSRNTPTEGGGTLFEDRSTFRMATFGQLQEIITAGAALTDAAGALQRFDYFYTAGPMRLTARGEVRGDAIMMEIFQAGESNQLTFPISKPPHVSMSLGAAINRVELSAGTRFSVPFFDPITMSEGQMDMEVTAVEVLENGDEAWWLDMRFGSLDTRALVTPTGEVLRQEAPLGLSIVRMTREAARDVPLGDEPVDLIALSAVQLKGKLTDARTRRVVRLKIHGIEPDRVRHEPPLQTVSAGEVTVDIPILAELPSLPLRDASEPIWLESTLSLPASHPDIRERAREVLSGSTDRLDAVQRLTHHVADYVQDAPVMGVPNGLEVLQTARGDCNEHTALFVSLARAAGIPTRIAAGVVYSERIGPRGAFYYHAWPEVRLGGPTEWVPVDPTFDQVPADATHVKLVEGDLDRQVEIMAFMGRLGFELLEAR